MEQDGQIEMLYTEMDRQKTVDKDWLGEKKQRLTEREKEHQD